MRRPAFTNDPDGTRLPVKLDTATNGEFAPVPLEPVHLHARQRAMEDATRNAKRLGVDRRSFLVSASGVATARTKAPSCPCRCRGIRL